MDPKSLAHEYLDTMYDASVASQYASYGLELEYDSIPEDVIMQAKRSLLDGLGCAIGAFGEPGSQACLELVDQLGGVEEATLFDSGRKTSAANAALANSFLVRYLDYNDSGGGGHNSDAIPSLLAIAEREQASGEEFITSLIVSYELGKRFREGIQAGERGREAFHTTGVTNDIRGGVSMPPAIGRLLGLTRTEIANAIGICASRNAPLKILDADTEELTGTKNLRFGSVAYDAILSCILASNDFTGPIRVVEGDQGIINGLFDGDPQIEPMIDFSGWRIRETDYKTLCANSTSHGHMLATKRIVTEHDLQPSDIESVEITASAREVRHTTSIARKYPRNAETANHSAHYANAIMIRDRDFTPDAFNQKHYEDPTVLDLIDKISITVDPDLPVRSLQGASTITTLDGDMFHERVESPKGYGNRLNENAVDAQHMERLSNTELEKKFSRMATDQFTEERVTEQIQTVWNIETLDDVGELASLLVVD